jgi:hypothetical protein
MEGVLEDSREERERLDSHQEGSSVRAAKHTFGVLTERRSRCIESCGVCPVNQGLPKSCEPFTMSTTERSDTPHHDCEVGGSVITDTRIQNKSRSVPASGCCQALIQCECYNWTPPLTADH